MMRIWKSLTPMEWLGLIVVAALVFIWPVRGTIALRNVLLFVALALWLYAWSRQTAEKPRLHALRPPLFWYGVLTAWLLAGAFFVSVDTLWSLQELKGQWLRSMLAGILGLLIAGWAVRPRFDRSRAVLCLMVIIAPVMLQVVITLADTVWLWAKNGYLPLREARLTGGKLGVSVNINFFFGIVIAEILARTNGDEALLPFSTRTLAILSVLALACTYVIGARNGTLCLVGMVLVAFAIHYRWRRHAGGQLKWVAAGLIVIGLLAYVNLKSDQRWVAFEESVALAWDTQTNRAWLDSKIYPLPVMHNGQSVDHSSYMRLAWIKEGTKALIEHPLGVGFGRNAMGQAFQQKYGQGLGGHSDNGFIDFSIGAGVPGVLLGGAFLLSLMWLGWRTHANTRSAIGLAAFFVVLSYLSRTMLDSTTRDNYLEQFLFMAALFATLCAGLLAEGRNADIGLTAGRVLRR